MSDQSPFEVKICELDEHVNFKYKKTLSGSLIKVLVDAQNIAERYNDVSAVIDHKSWLRIETQSYPGDSLREIILNAFCHTNYFMSSNIKIEFTKSKARIISPGGLFNMEVEDMLSGILTYRNPHLVRVLHKLGYIENFGTGLNRTIEAYENELVKPEFQNSEHFLSVVLPNLNYKDDLLQKSSQIFNRDLIKSLINKMSELEKTILTIIDNNPGIGVNNLVKTITETRQKVSKNTVIMCIKHDLKYFCEFRGSKKDGGYFANILGNSIVLFMRNKDNLTFNGDILKCDGKSPIKEISEVEKTILTIIDNNIGINLNDLHDILNKMKANITIQTLKTYLKRNLKDFCEFRGPKRYGGYYIKEK